MNSKMHYFRLDLPHQWENDTIYVFRGPLDGSMQHYLRLVVHPKPISGNLREFAQDGIATVKTGGPSMEFLREEARTLENGHEVFEFAYRTMPSDDAALFHKYVYMILKKKGYVFSCEFTKRSRKTVGLEVERILNSFEPLDL